MMKNFLINLVLLPQPQINCVLKGINSIQYIINNNTRTGTIEKLYMFLEFAILRNGNEIMR